MNVKSQNRKVSYIDAGKESMEHGVVVMTPIKVVASYDVPVAEKPSKTVPLEQI